MPSADTATPFLIPQRAAVARRRIKANSFSTDNKGKCPNGSMQIGALDKQVQLLAFTRQDQQEDGAKGRSLVH